MHSGFVSITRKMEMPEKRAGRPALNSPNTKKRKRRELMAMRQRSKVHIGVELDRWNSLKAEIKLKTHKEVATLLIDKYVSYKTGVISICKKKNVISILQCIHVFIIYACWLVVLPQYLYDPCWSRACSSRNRRGIKIDEVNNVQHGGEGEEN